MKHDLFGRQARRRSILQVAPPRVRGDFNKKLVSGDKDAVAAGWQRHYMRGEKQTGDKIDSHVTKRRLKPPKDV